MERVIYKKYYDYPFGKSPIANGSEYIKIWNEERVNSYPVVDEYELQLGYQIDNEWFHELALVTQVVIKQSRICYQHGRLLYATLAHYVENNDVSRISIFETGTARGFSALCMAKALEDYKVCGTIITFDILPHDVQMYWNSVSDEEGPRTREELLIKYQSLIEKYIVFHQGDTGRELMKVKIPRVHFAFLDATHTYDQIWKEFNCIRNYQQAGDIVFFDDYTPAKFPGVVEAVNEICQKAGYSKHIVTVSEQRGYVVAEKSP